MHILNLGNLRFSHSSKPPQPPQGVKKSSICRIMNKLDCVSCSVMSNSLWSHGLYSLPGSSVHGILQARIPEWFAISFYRGSFKPREWTCVSCLAGRFFIIWATRDAKINGYYCLKPFKPQSFGVACYIAVMTAIYPNQLPLRWFWPSL